MLTAFRRIVASDTSVQRLQENVGLVLRQITRKELIDGVLVSAQITAAGTVVSHTLGRQPIGWFIVDVEQPVGALTGAPIVRTAWNDKSITLVSQGVGLGYSPVTLWVF